MTESYEYFKGVMLQFLEEGPPEGKGGAWIVMVETATEHPEYAERLIWNMEDMGHALWVLAATPPPLLDGVVSLCEKVPHKDSPRRKYEAMA